MTPEQIIQIVLWVPFGLVVLISGIIFCVSGYKKGLWRALMALGATFVSALISLLLARLLGGVVAATVLEKLPPMNLGNLPQTLVADLIGGFIKMGISLVLFSLFMLILTVILRSACDLIAKGKLQPKNKGMKFLGMVTGAVAAVCYTLLLLLPLYGTLGAYLPVVESMMSLSGEQNSEAGRYLQQITRHPVVQVSGSGPVGAVYSGLAALDVGGSSLDVAQMARTADKMMNVLNDLSSADPEQLPAEAKKLIQIARDEVVQEKWFYDMAQEGIAALRAQLRETAPADAPEAMLVNRFLDIVDCPQKDFGKNCAAILDFAEYCLDHDIVGIFEGEDSSRLYSSGIVAKAGALANCTPEAVEVKKLLLSTFIAGAQKMDPAEAVAYIDSLGIGTVTDPAMQLKEAEAILLLMGECPAEAVMRHPNMGEAVLQQWIEQNGFAAAMGIHDEDFAEKVNKDPALQNEILSVLRQSVSEPLGTETFTNYLQRLQYGEEVSE